MTRYDIDFAVALVARRQFGLLTHAQAVVAGATDRMIAARLRHRRWLLVAPALYTLPGHPSSWRRQCMAAVLGETEAVISRSAAAVLHEFPGFRPGRIDITVPRWRNHRSTLATVHESNLVQHTTVEGIAVVTAAQALIEVARYRDTQRLGVLLDEIDKARRGRLLPAIQERYVEVAHARWPGLGRVRAVLAVRDGDGYVPHDSLLEAKLWAILSRLRPAPAMVRQGTVPWREAGTSRVDVLIPEWRAIVEADGRRWHTRVRDFEVDRERDNEAVLHGFRPLRFTWQQVTERARWVLDSVERLRPSGTERVA